MGMMMKMADPKILFHSVPDLGDGLIPLYLIGGQLSTPRGFSHDAILDLIKTQKLSVLLSKIALVGKDLFDRIFGMTAASNAQGEKRTVVKRGRGHFCGQDKAITGVYGSMLFQTKKRFVVLDRPVGIEIAGKLHRLSPLIQVALRRLSFDLFFFQFALADGMTYRLYQTGIDGNAFIDG